MRKNLITELRSQKMRCEELIRTTNPNAPEHRALQREWSEISKELEQAHAANERDVRHSLKAGKLRTEAGAAFGQDSSEFQRARGGAVDDAIRTLESHYPRSLSSEAAVAMEELVREHDTPTAVGARYISAVGDDAYNTAFQRILADPATGHLRMTAQEHAAMQRVRAVEEERAMNEGVGSAGQFALPLTIDPTVMISSNGALNPIRQLATVTNISTFTWRGVSSDGVTAAYGVEAGTASDNSPTLAQPTATPSRAQVFVPFSYELGQDWQGLQTELLKLFTDAKDVLENTKFLSGSGTAEPAGLLGANGLGTAQKVLTAGTATFTAPDVYSVRQAVPARWYKTSTVAWHPAVGDAVYKLVAQADPTNAQLMPNGRGGDLLGWPVAEWSAMNSAPTTTGQQTILAGDFKTGYRIIDRIGMSVELIPNLFGTNGYPTGQRGMYAFWRNTAVVQVPNALRYLQVK